MRLARQLMALVLASLFLVSFTGISLLIHHCLACDTTDIALPWVSADEACAMHERHTETASCHLPAGAGHDSECCDIPLHEDNSSCGSCCESEVRYLKTDYEVAHEKTVLRVLPVETTMLTHHENVVEDVVAGPPTSGLFIRSDRPPPKPVGRAFVIYSHQLRIA